MTDVAMRFDNSIILNHIYYLSICIIFTLIDDHLLWVHSYRTRNFEWEQ